MEGAVPEPESLDGPGVRPRFAVTGLIFAQDTAPPAATSSGGPTSTARPSARAAPSAAIDLLAGPPSSTSTTSRAASSLPQLSAPSRSAAPSVPSVPAPSVKAPSGGGLFDLDFHAPAAPPAPVAKRDAKADILSLFAASPPPPSHNQQQFSNGISQGMGGLSLGGNGAGFGGSDPWGATTAGSSAGGGFGDFSDFGSAPVAGRVSCRWYTSCADSTAAARAGHVCAACEHGRWLESLGLAGPDAHDGRSVWGFLGWAGHGHGQEGRRVL